MFPEIMGAVTGQVFAAYAAIAKGYKRFRMKGKIYPGLVCEPGASTQGYVYANVNERALWYLDHFEDQVYVRRFITVRNEREQQNSTFAYLIPEESRTVLTSEKWNQEEFLATHFKDYVDACKAFHVQISRKHDATPS